ncbi:glycoside hydrolase family 38 C-terminal domain-containing protein [Frondihabitans sp. VKM Ac-2883]|uniref:alpha-mannosidase n=1 Tax=Frondihabitans sp. VKM Ac-2883 TaxID=2783823 RepID=UPI00188D1601|nr:glycoside hydrolase family 38 C-terminal domain-containing protein [Frondihabitans sp. VKM Ac-2883]MBF4574829.1 alpha-mannosidase [Frondihabitans sp. VKM Ac-2883]
MHDNSASVEVRVDRFVLERLIPALYRRSHHLTVEAWDVPDEPVPFAEAVAQEFTPFAVGTPWSKPWGTTWFHVTGEVPAGWGSAGTALELLVDLGFSTRQPGFQAEGLVFRPDGTIVKAIEPYNGYVPIDVAPGDRLDFYIEAASNPDVGGNFFYIPTPLGDKATAGTESIYTLRQIDLVERDVDVYELERDVWSLLGLMRELEPTLPRRAEILRALERVCDVVDPDDVASTAGRGRAALEAVLASPAYASAHAITAVGHAHIDSAWLWPTRETVRKCARTFSNVLQLMDVDPDFVFACSSAQQFSWMKQFYPELFERIRTRVAEGRFVPVGGMWVESDTNMPGGEALVRQFVHGKGFFLREFGYEPKEVWLPDSFGYTAALPQIVRASGSDSFLTQKISWNDTNRMPHHSFLWEGIDGSQVFTHFPPSDTYNSDLAASDLARAQRQYAEKGASNISMGLFGWGDGGGGPTREMLAAAKRTHDLEGSPKVTIGSPQQFFDEAKATLPHPSVWSGEMYLELHRGTYTSQANTKQGNRVSEHLLREAELWSATAATRGLLDYPYDELTDIWQTVLLQQFHDILPGSSIAWVHQQAEENYARIARELETLIGAAQRALAGSGDAELVFNASPVAAGEVAPLGAGADGRARTVRPVETSDGITLDNGLLSVRLDAAGSLVSVRHLASGRELVAPGEVAARLQIFRDTPNQWDAWDIDRHYKNNRFELDTPDSVSIAGDVVEVVHTHGQSTFTQRYWLVEGEAAVQLETEIDWHETEKLLKLAFPLDVRAEQASSEIQFGHINRPTAVNTSWDYARFETIAHRWVHVGEPGFGIAVANGSTYGHDITRSTRDDGGTTTLVRESLLRAPRFPDPEADQGVHVLRTALAVADTVLDAAAYGYRLNLPARTISGAGSDGVAPILTVSSPAVLVESVKLAEDRSGDLVVRLYEAQGGRARATIGLGVPVVSAWTTDLIERELSGDAAARWGADDAIELELRPFQVVTLRVKVG